MSCITKITRDRLTEVFKNEEMASNHYQNLSSNKFLNIFGDWRVDEKDVNKIDPNEIDPTGERLNEQNEPRLYTKKVGGKDIHYYLDKFHNRIDVTPRTFEYLNIENRSTKIKEVVNIIAGNIFKQNIKANFNDLESINNININKAIDEFIDSEYEEALSLKEFLPQILNQSDKQILQDYNGDEPNPAKHLSIEEIKEDIDNEMILNDERLKISEKLKFGKADLKNQILSYFKSKSLIINDSTNEIEEEEEKDNNEDRGESVASVEKNTKDKAGANIKLLLAFLPAYRINKLYKLADGNDMFEQVQTSLFQSSKFIDGNTVHDDLLKLLSDVVPTIKGGKIEDVFNKMLILIKSEFGEKPHYRDLVEILESKDFNQSKKSEFVAAMNHSKNEHYVTENDLKNGVFKRFDAAKQSSVESKILKNWEQKIVKKFTKDGKINSDLLYSIIDKYKNSFDRQNAIFSGIDLDTVNLDRFSSEYKRAVLNEKKGLISIFKQLGIDNIDEFVMHSVLVENNQSETFAKDVRKNITDLYSALNQALLDFKKNKDVENYSFIDNNKSRLFNDLAVYTAKTQNDIKDSTVYSMNKMFWVYGNPSFLSNTINLFKEDKQLLKDIRKKSISKHSLFVDYLLAEELDSEGKFVYVGKDREDMSNKRLDEFSSTRFLQYQEKNKADKAVDNKSISSVDQIIDRFGKVMGASITNDNGELTGSITPIYSTILPADKSTAYEIKIGQFFNETLENIRTSKDMSFTKETTDKFYNYFTDEYNRMVDAFNDLKTQKYEDLKLHYHTDKNGNVGSYDNINGDSVSIKTFEDYQNNNQPNKKLVGQAFKSQISPEINYNTLKSKLAASNIFNSDNSPNLGKNELNEDVHKANIVNILNGMLTTRLVENVSSLIKKGIIKRLSDNSYTFAAIDNKIRNTYNAEDGVFTRSSLYHMVSDYTINTIIANVEYTKLFTGDPAYYKTMVDFFKRVPATYTDGTYLRLGLTEGDSKFNMAVVEDQVAGSKYYENLDNSLKLAGITNKKERENIIGGYKESVDQTDAQAWITPARWKFILDRAGKWTDAHNAVYDKMLNENKEPFTAKELKLSSQPLKGVYYGVVNGVPTYMKYSQAVLSPILVNESKLETLYNEMINQGVDEAVTVQGVKVGANIPVNISGDKINFNIQKLNNFEWKLQQDLPVKLMKQTLLGSQIQKNIYSSVKKDEIYNVDGIEYRGFGIIDHINSILSDISNKGIEKLAKILGKEEDNTINKEKLYEIIQQEIDDNPDDFSDNIKDAVNKRMLIEAMPSMRDKMYSILFSKIRRAASNTKTNGGSFIQMSNYGIDIAEGNKIGVTWLVEPSELKPPTLYEDKDGNIKQKPGQVFISHSDIAKAIPNYRKMTIKELNEKLDPEILKIIGYRIPNQGMSSNDSLDIVGILPPNMNDTIIAYTEITTKTGSDFDIDKMYVMLPELKYTYNKKTYKAAKKYLNNVIKNNVSNVNDVNEITEFYDDLVEQTGIQLTKEEMVTLFSATDEYLLEDQYFNIIVDHIVKGESKASKALAESIGEGNISKIEKAPSNKETTKGLNNMLFDAYWSILTNKSTYPDLIRPIDFDYVKNHIKSLNTKGDVNENFKFYDGIYQVDLKNTYMLGKAGVGISANMAVDHNISKNMVNLRFNQYNIGDGLGFVNAKNETVFDTNPLTGTSSSIKLTVEESKIAAARIKENTGEKVSYKTLRSFKIGDTISAFMNAFVDNAKDPYIEQGNYDTYTSNVAFMLTRAGVHPYWTDAFIGQPILKKLTEFTKNFESISVQKEDKHMNKSSYEALLYDTVSKHINNTDPFLINKEIEKLKKTNRQVYSYSELVDSYNSDIENPTIKDIEILMTFKDYQDKSKKLESSVNLSRFDTLGSGKNFSDMLVYQNNLLDLFNKQEKDGELNGHMEKYVRNNKLTSLGTQLLNSVFFASDILNANPSIFLSANREFLNVIDNISMTTASSYGGSMGRSTDKKMISKLSKELYSSLMSKYPVLQIEGNPVDFVNDVKERIIKYQNKQAEKNGNAFINVLTFYENSFGIDISKLDVNQKNDISNAFYDIYKNDFILGKDIIRSSFVMNGFNQSLIDFNDMIPHEFFLNYHKVNTGNTTDSKGNVVNQNLYQSVQAFIREQMIKMSNSSYAQSFHKEYAQNNYEDNKIVRKINADLIIGIQKTNNLVYINNQKSLKSYKVDSRKNSDNSTDLSTESYTPYIKTESLSFDSEDNQVALYEYVGNIKRPILNPAGQTTDFYYAPVYERIEKKGYRNKSSKVTYKEYGKKQSSFLENNDGVNPKKDDIANQLKVLDFVEAAKTAHYLESQRYKNVDALKDLIFNSDIKQLEKTLQSEENVLSLQNVNETGENVNSKKENEQLDLFGENDVPTEPQC